MEQGKYILPKTAYIHDDFETRNPPKQASTYPFKNRGRTQLPSHLLFDIEKTRISENLVPSKIRKPDFSSRITSPIPFTAPSLRSSGSGFSKKLLGPLRGANATRPSTDNKLTKSQPFFGPSPPPTQAYKLDVLDYGLDMGNHVQSGISSINYEKDSIRRGSSVPATFKKLPHLIFKTGDDEKVIMALSSLQDHGYISKSPSHSKALTLSRRGYVEFHKEGLTELTDVATLEMHMQKFSMVSKHIIIQKFREFKYLRKWDRALRKRKFDDRRKSLERLLIQANIHYWGCVQRVMAECVQLQTDVHQPPWDVPAFGLTLDTVSHELQRRCDGLVDALEATRSRISQLLSQFFDSISSEQKVSRLKRIYQLNRMHNSQAASTLASKDVHMICRVYCLCEHILCQTAIKLHNAELCSLSLLLANKQGVLQIEAFMQLNQSRDIPRKLPFSPADATIAADAAGIVLIPDGQHVLETFTRDMNTIFNSIASWMQPRIVEDLASFLPPDFLAVSFKPDYRHCLPNSYDYICSHSMLRNSITQADTESLMHCQQCLDHIKPIFAYVESFSSGFGSPLSEKHRQQLDSYPQNADQYILWREIVVKLPGQESQVRCFRLKYRRFKSHLQERLQHEVIDQTFKQYFVFAGQKLADLKVTGAKYLRHLEEEISTYQQLIVSLPFIYELEQKVDLYIEDIQAATRMRETLQKHYLDTTSGVDGTSKFVLPVLNQHLADQMRAHYSDAISRIKERHSQHIDIVQAVHSDFLQCFKSFETQLRGPSLRSISSNVLDVKKLLGSLKLEFQEFQLKAEEISNIMDLMKLRLMDMDQLENAQSVLIMLDEVWSEIEVWKSFFTTVMHTPISELQKKYSEFDFFEISVRVKKIVLKHDGAELVSGLKSQFSDFEKQWPIIQKLMDPKMKKSHFEVLIAPSKSLINPPVGIMREPQIDLSQITISNLVEKGFLSDASRLSNVYALAAKEEAMFGLSERLQRSVECLSVHVRSEAGIMWLEGFDTALTQVQDHVDALDWLQSSGFAGMVMKELVQIGARNTEIKELLLKLQKCSVFWSRNRTLLNVQFPLEIQMKDSFLLETAHMKWIRCMKLFDATMTSDSNNPGRNVLVLSKLEASTVQKIQDALDSWEKTTSSWEGAVQQMRNDFPRLYLLDDHSTLDVFSYFASIGPDMSPYTLSRCFSNTQSFEFNELRHPIRVFGAHGECLPLICDAVSEKCLERQSRLNFAKCLLKSAVRLQILQVASEVEKKTGQDCSSDFFSNLNFSSTTQAFLIGFQVYWSERFVEGSLEANSKLHQEIDCTLNMVLQIIRGADNVNRTDRISRTNADQQAVLERARFQGIILVCQQWNSFLRACSVNDSMPATPFYKKNGSDLLVKFGPCTLQYGCEFLDVTESVTQTPQTNRYTMYILSCFCSQTFGMVLGPEGCGKTNGLRQTSAACGWLMTVFDSSANEMRADIYNVVKGCILGGSWLCIRNSDAMLGESMSQLAKSIAKTYEILRQLSGMNLVKVLRPPVFLVNRASYSLTTLPSQMREITRPFHLEVVDKQVVIEVLLKSHGIMDSDIILKFQSFVSVLSLILPSHEARNCLSSYVLKDVLQQVCTGATQQKSGSEISTSKSGFHGDQRMFYLGEELLIHLRRQLCSRLYYSCEVIVKHYFRNVDPAHQNCDDLTNSVQRVNSAIISMSFRPAPKFLECCLQMFQALVCNRRPTMVVGPPQSGKSSSIHIVRLAQIIDLTGSAKDFVPKTLISILNKNGFYPAVSDSEFWTHIESQANRNLLGAGLIFGDQWIVVDSEGLGSADMLLHYMLERHRRADSFSNLSIMRPRFFLETCSIADAHPSMVSSSNVIYLDSVSVDRKDVFEAWCGTMTSKMEERDLSELCQLVDNHVGDVVAFIACECSQVTKITNVSLTKTFCLILEHHFFLGRATALRRTTKFCRSAFIFATIWSYGALIRSENRAAFSEWFKNRMINMNVCTFDGEQRVSSITMWDYVVGEENMGLIPISDKEFDVDTRIQRQLLLAPTKEMCMYEYMYSIYKLQKKNMLFFGGSNVGKTFFLELMERKSKNDSKISELKMICNRETNANQLCKWLLASADQLVMTNTKLVSVVLLVDDLHLPVSTGPIHGLFRYTCEHKGVLELKKYCNDKQLSRINVVASCDISRAVSCTTRWLGHFALVPMIPYCFESLTKIATTTSELGAIIPSNSVKSVFARLPTVLTDVYKWVAETAVYNRSEDLFLRWTQVHLHISVKALSFVSWSDMDGPNLCLSYVWHDLMRIYSDRMTNVQQIGNFRSGLKAKLIEAIGRNHARTVNFASERQAFYILLPVKSSMNQPENVNKSWDFHEISHEDLVQKAVDCMQGWDLSRRKVIYIPGFARHLSHALHMLRPSSKVHSCILVGPRGSCKKSIIRTASIMCKYKVILGNRGIGVRDIQGCLKGNVPSVFLFYGPGLNFNAEVGQYIHKLFKGQNLELFERGGLSNVRFAFCVDIDCTVVENSLAGCIPENFDFIIGCSTVDWYEGWTDLAISELIQRECSWSVPGSGVPMPNKFKDAIYSVYIHIESASQDFLCDEISSNFPLPGSVVDFMSRFTTLCKQTSQEIRNRSDTLKQAVQTFDLLKEYERELLNQQEKLEPLVNHVTEIRVKCREDAARFERIAKRAQEIAESEMIGGLQDVLYGDAPGQDLQQEFQDSKVQLSAATALIKELRQAHMTQLEISKEHPDLQDLLFGSLSACLGLSELDALNLKESATSIPTKIQNIDLNRVSRERIYQLRPFVSDSRFIPEKLFAINRAAGALCHWVKCFERFAKANEWIKPDSISNEKQSLERVRGLAKIRLSALEEVQSSVQHSKQKRIDAIQEEATTKDQLSIVRSQLQYCHTIIAALTGICASWKVEMHELEKRLLTLEGDCLLSAATTTFLGLFTFERRQQIILRIQNSLKYPDEGTINQTTQRTCATSQKSVPVSEEFSLSIFCNADFWLKQWEKSGLSQDKCTRENIVLALSTAKIPFFVDPHGQATSWLLASFPTILHISSVDIKSTHYTKERIKSILESAKANNQYVLLEDTVELLSDLFLVFDENPLLFPTNQDAFPGSRYRVFLTGFAPKLQDIINCDASCLFTFIDMCPDTDALESIARSSILSHFDFVSHARQHQFIEDCWKLRGEIKETEESIFTVLQLGPETISSLRDGDDKMVSLCNELLCARTSFQDLLMVSMSSMRTIESYDGLVLLLARILACMKGPCKIILGQDYSEHVLNIIKSCSAHVQLDAEDCWSLKFKNDLNELSSLIIKTTSSYLMSINPEQSCLLNFFIYACRTEDDLKLAQDALVNIIGAMCGTSGTIQRDSSMRTHGPGQLFSSSGWKCFLKSSATFGIEVDSTLTSLNKILTREFRTKTLDSCMIQQAISLLHLEPFKKLVITCCINPQYLQFALETLSLESFKQPSQSKINSIIRPNLQSSAIFLPHKTSIPINQVYRYVIRDSGANLDSNVSSCLLTVYDEDELGNFMSNSVLSTSCLLCVHHHSTLVKALAHHRIKEMRSRVFYKFRPCYVVFSGFQDGSECNLNLASFNIGFLQFCTDDAHPSDIFECIIADLWHRKLKSDQSICFWRAVLGICYFFSIMYHQQRLGLPAEIIEIPLLRLQQVIQCIRLMEHCAFELVCNPVLTMHSIVGYTFFELFCSAGSFAKYVLESIVNETLFDGQGERLIMFKTEMEPPENHKSTWKKLFEFASSLPTIQLASDYQIPSRWSLDHVDLMKMRKSLRNLRDPTAESVMKVSTVSIKTILEQLPVIADLEVTDVTGYFQAFKDRSQLKDSQLSILESLMMEILREERLFLRNQVGLVRCDLDDLYNALAGKTIHSKTVLENTCLLEQGLTPDKWKLNMKGCEQLNHFLDCIQEKAKFLGNMFHQIQDSEKRSRATLNSLLPSKFPLHLFQSPRKILDIFCLAYSLVFQDGSINDVCFCALPVTYAAGFLSDNSPAPEFGFLVSGIQIFGAKFCPSTWQLNSASHTSAELTQPYSCWLKPVCGSSLPFRSQMKAEKLYWSDVPLYPAVPMDRATFAIEIIARIFVLSKFNPSKLRMQQSICLFLGN